ncbi:MAG: hypothetical protein NVS3B2_04730 [Ramlibacter sp.]
MSTVFESSFHGPRATPRAAATPTRDPGWLHRLALWLGLARAAPARKAAAPQRGHSQQQRAALFAACEQMLAQARRDNHALSVVVFDLSDLPELETVFGAPIVRQVLAEVAIRLQDLATSRGLVIRSGPTLFTVLLPGIGRDRAYLAIEKTMGRPCCIELNAGDHEIVLVPDFKLHAVRAGSPGLAQIQLELRQQIAQAQKQERLRRRYLQKERESHTRALALRTDAARAQLAVRQPPAAVHLPTVPVPLRS